MSNTQQSPDPIVYEEKSITDKPEKEGWYFIKFWHLNDEIYSQNLYSNHLGWVETMDTNAIWLKPTPLSSLLKDKQKRIEELEAERDNFAISFAGWVISPEGQMYLATKMSASQLLKTYKDRPYINIDSSKQ